MVAKELTPEALFAAGSGFQHWSGVATFLRCPHQPGMSNTDIGLIGFPWVVGWEKRLQIASV